MTQLSKLSGWEGWLAPAVSPEFKFIGEDSLPQDLSLAEQRGQATLPHLKICSVSDLFIAPNFFTAPSKKPPGLHLVWFREISCDFVDRSFATGIRSTKSHE